MTKNKLMTVAAIAVLLAACAKKEAEAPAADAAAPAAETAAPVTEAAPAATEAAPADAAAADAAAPVASGLPQVCEDYLARAKACFDKAGGNGSASAFQQGVDQVKAQWDQVADKSALEAGCKAANDQFAQTASILKCE